MTQEQQAYEMRKQFGLIIARWCPQFSIDTEDFQQQILRALLHFNAYDLDAQRVLRGENPIRTDYPLPLPKP